MDDRLKRNLMIGVTVMAVGVCGYYVWNTFGEDETLRSANRRVIKCSETGQEFKIKITRDLKPYPHENPKTGTKTLYPTEVCYWDECGKQRGTRVILNVWLGKEGPTKCPVCEHTVRPHNPKPPGWKGLG